MPEVNLTEWNHFLKSHPNAHLLQMGEWGELKRGFGWKPARVISTSSTHRIPNNEIGAQILFRRLPLGLTLGYMPKPVDSGQWTGDGEKFWKEVDSICKKNHAIFLKIEPDAWEETFDFRPSTFDISPHNIQPPRTIVISIKDSEEQILARMKPKCRYNIRLAEKKGITVRTWDDIPAFHEMMTVTGGRDNFGVHSKEYYQRAYELFHPKGTCELLVAEFEGKPLASLMVFADATRAWYVYGASNDQERNRMPTYLLQWEAIRWAKARGCEEYDLWGVPDENEETLEANFENRHDGLWGVYRFKRGFGGQLKRAAQALDRVYNPLLYWAYLRFLGNR
ncbi:MAG: peptidoglycan bridge formation glycyltransferase FemA/FemB family protein [Anaerolineales bacterium]|uniref:lipid II:glycine glycyltransferase FemX n=1 Tax=Candidatus Villigracilis proximus TaxID=3140683 RepID=UPI0031371888|nr:peptidoglycan bridge formation glycyltransferase FemA/FemB family protein [Anaerolineales bacterium]